MKREINSKSENKSKKTDIVYTTIMVRHKDKIMSGFIMERPSSNEVFIDGYKHEDGRVKRFKTPDMTMDKLKEEWVIVEDLRDN